MQELIVKILLISLLIYGLIFILHLFGYLNRWKRMSEIRKAINKKTIKSFSDIGVRKFKIKSEVGTILEFKSGIDENSNLELAFTTNQVYFLHKKLDLFKFFGKKIPIAFNKRLHEYSMEEINNEFDLKFKSEKNISYIVRFGGDQMKLSEFKTFFDEWLKSK